MTTLCAPPHARVRHAPRGIAHRHRLTSAPHKRRTRTHTKRTRRPTPRPRSRPQNGRMDGSAAPNGHITGNYSSGRCLCTRAPRTRVYTYAHTRARAGRRRFKTKHLAGVRGAAPALVYVCAVAYMLHNCTGRTDYRRG